MLNSKGISLLELLITLAVLSVLTTVSIISISEIISKAEKDAVLVEVSTIESAFRHYCLDQSCKDDFLYHVSILTHPATFSAYYDSTHKVLIDTTRETDLIFIYKHPGNTQSIIYYHPSGYWYLDNVFDYHETILEDYPFSNGEWPAFMDHAQYNSHRRLIETMQP